MKKIILSFSLIFTPLIVFSAPLSGIKGLLIGVSDIVKLAIPVAYGICVLAFFWGMANFIIQSGNPEAKNKSKDIMIWGIVAMFVISSIFGIVAFIRNIIGIPSTSNTPGQNTGSGSGDSVDGYDLTGHLNTKYLS